MQLLSFIVCRKYVLKSGIIFLAISADNLAVAEPLTYSPDQWPRHWNVLITKTNLQKQISNQESKGNYFNQLPARSPVWGVVPKERQKRRRSLRPEYDTNYHMRNYYGQNLYGGHYHSYSTAYALPMSHHMPAMNPYGVAVMAPGLAAPGIPFSTYPLVNPSPFMTGYPAIRGMSGPGYFW